MVQVNPYLNFNGKCREAMEFYQDCLGGELYLQKVGESPMAAQMSSASAERILHSHLFNGAYTLMASDMMGNKLEPGNSVTLCLNCSSDAELYEYFEKLAAGGRIILHLHQTFWGSTYGELKDKFGMHWMLSLKKKL